MLLIGWGATAGLSQAGFMGLPSPDSAFERGCCLSNVLLRWHRKARTGSAGGAALEEFAWKLEPA
jgi:hypothetical protein